MNKIKTVHLLAAGSLLTLVLAVGSWFMPRVGPSNQDKLWGLFVGYNSAFLLSLKTDDGTPPNSPSGPAPA